MGQLIDGVWRDEDIQRHSADGRFTRAESAFRNWITADGAPGPSGEGGFAAEAGRYHLYVSLACPWAHRTIIMRSLKGLEHLIGLSVTHWDNLDQGWNFRPGDGVVPDPNLGAEHLHQLYTTADPAYSGRVSVPTLWDTERRTIVNNESADIIRMFNSAFDELGDNRVRSDLDFYPADLRGDIDAINEEIYETVNNGVYRTGFAKSQEAYDEAVTTLFETLDRMEARLASRRYLAGDRITEADWRFFTTLIRFDLVYYGHFKCNLRRLADYPNLNGYVTELYQVPGVAETVDFHHTKSHYYGSQRRVNPTGIVPIGPAVDFSGDHDRDRIGPADSLSAAA